jgi:hypothetical protein
VGRYYDPATGQFLSVDPLVNLTAAPYFYAGDDPVNGTDPSGLYTVPATGDCDPTECQSQLPYYQGCPTSTGRLLLSFGELILAAGAGPDVPEDAGLDAAAGGFEDGSSTAAARLGAEGNVSSAFTTKAAAREALASLDATDAQLAGANSAIARATSSSTIEVGVEGTNVVVRILRPGGDGYQVMQTIVQQDGTKSVVQLAYNASGQLVHYDPKTP